MDILTRLPKYDVVRLMRCAKAAQKVEHRGFKKVDEILEELEQQCVDAIMQGKQEPPDVNFLPMLLETVYQAMQAGLDTEPRLPPNTIKMAAMPVKRVKLPSNPKELRLWWDLVRHVHPPKNLQVLAKKIKTAYIRKANSIWSQVSSDFREGKVWNQEIVKEKIKTIFAVPRARARVIVATETTRYYNQVRINYYDKVDVVTHYLFIAIRDHRTTPWCKTRQGLVYEKKSDLFRKEKPPTHYNCRSEITPLSPFNPEHKKLINDKSIQRENRKPVPLMKGWNE
jgi:SPP1 gp7 family putative phage head morphogenesis protein